MGLFRFKQFQLTDQHCAMKVGTDGVLLAAWAKTKGKNKVLDIGCGTGLISLILAQCNPFAHIHGIDINEKGIAEALHNFSTSPWPERLSAQIANIKTYKPNCSFDLIISNPPFFSQSSKAKTPDKSLAKHDDQLPPNWLFDFAKLHLSENGRLALVYPFDRFDELVSIGKKKQLFLQRDCQILPKANKSPNRVLMEFGRHHQNEIAQSTISIRNTDNNFSAAYQALTAPFYLKF